MVKSYQASHIRKVSLVRDSNSCCVFVCCRYDACIEASDSDHKPVRCLLDVDLAVIDEAGRRREFGDIMQRDQKVLAFVERCNVIPHTRLERNKIMLEGHSISTVLLTNDSKRSWTTFTVHCEGLHYNNECPCQSYDDRERTSSQYFSRGAYGFPQWLQVSGYLEDVM